MHFHDHAGTEIAALVDRLLDRQLEQSRRDLEGVRQAAGLAAQTLETAPSNRPQIQPAEVTDIVDRLTAAADARARSAAQRACDEAKVTLDQLRAEIDQHIQTNTELTASLVQARAHAETLESESPCTTFAVYDGQSAPVFINAAVFRDGGRPNRQTLGDCAELIHEFGVGGSGRRGGGSMQRYGGTHIFRCCTGTIEGIMRVILWSASVLLWASGPGPPFGKTAFMNGRQSKTSPS